MLQDILSLSGCFTLPASECLIGSDQGQDAAPALPKAAADPEAAHCLDGWLLFWTRCTRSKMLHEVASAHHDQ